MKLIHGDCLVEMNRLSEKTVNCIITSPPYNVDLGNNKYKKENSPQEVELVIKK